MVFKFIKVISTIFSIILGIQINNPFSLPKLDIPLVEKQEKTIAKLTIPAISLEQYLYDKDDDRSNLDERLIFLQSSDYPYEEKGNVVIVGHSGFGEVAYFKNLYRLKLGDIIILNYNNKEFIYKIVDMYKVYKTGEVEIVRDSNKKAITLITCYGNKEQLVVIGEQKSNT